MVVEPSKVRLTSSETHSCMVVNIPFHQHGTKEVVDAKRKELDKLKSFGAFVEVNEKDLSPDQRSKIVSTTWAVVFKPQGNNGEGLTKARLCAQGDWESEIFRTDRPTGAKGSLFV